jgi:hypothetical protein
MPGVCLAVVVNWLRLFCFFDCEVRRLFCEATVASFHFILFFSKKTLRCATFTAATTATTTTTTHRD